jgi:DHA2 family methylenomycin A resistance protein-like MFS transporter
MTHGRDGSSPLTWRVLLIILGPSLAYAIAAVDPLMLTLNLSGVGRGLEVPPSQMGLLAAASTLVVAASVLAVGNLGDGYGLKRVLMVGLGANMVVGIVSAISPNYVTLLALRFLDGLALSVLLGLSLALVSASVAPGQRAVAIGILMATDTVLYGVTPLIGGWVVETFGWRALFLVTPLIALVALLVTARYATESPRQREMAFDVLGVALFGVALLGLVAGIGAVPDGITEPRAWVPLSMSIFAVAGFALHERRTPEPALDPAVFTCRALMVTVLLAVVTVNLLAAGLGTVLGQLGGDVVGLSSQQVGLLYLPGTAVIALASVLAGRAVGRFTARPVLITGLLVIVASGLVLAFTASPTMTVAELVLTVWLSNFGGFVASTASADTILSQARAGKTGAVAAVQPAFGMTGYALGPTIYILLLGLFFQHEYQADAAARGMSAQSAEQSVSAVTMSMSHSAGTAGYDPNLAQLAHGLELPVDYTNAVTTTMLLVTLLPLAVTALAFFFVRIRRTPAADTAD